ncbi:MAG: acetyl-CoA carboxylase biotin carboxyl carrier protein, partial [Candidatus Brocadiales bacterium]
SYLGGGKMCSIDTVKELILLTNAHNLEEIEIHDDMTRIRIKKDLKQQHLHGVEQQISKQGFGVVAGDGKEIDNVDYNLRIAELTPHAANADSAPEFRIPNWDSEITSPMVGTFLKALSPGSKPFIDIGAEVNSEMIVGVVETMKIINEIKANVTGKVVEILVEDGEAIEFGQPLFRVQSMVSIS